MVVRLYLKALTRHHGHKDTLLTLTELVLFLFQQSGFKRFCSSAKAFASNVYILLSSFFIFFHLSPRITLMALQSKYLHNVNCHKMYSNCCYFRQKLKKREGNQDSPGHFNKTLPYVPIYQNLGG